MSWDRPRGFLTDREWLCECEPHLPGVLRQVRKDTANKRPQGEQCKFFLWEDEAEQKEIERLGKTLAELRRGATTTVGDNVQPAAAPPIPEKESLPRPAEPHPTRYYPLLAPMSMEDDEDVFPYDGTPTKVGDWGLSYDEERMYRKARAEKQARQEKGAPHSPESSPESQRDPSKVLYRKQSLSKKRSRDDADADTDPASPPTSPKRNTAKPRLLDPFSTPVKQISSTPHTPPDTRLHRSPESMLNPISYSLLLELSAAGLAHSLSEKLRDHLLRCSRVADGAVKGRDAARAALEKKDSKIEELERRIRILEAEREVDKAVVGALKRNIDILTGSVK